MDPKVRLNMLNMKYSERLVINHRRNFCADKCKGIQKKNGGSILIE